MELTDALRQALNPQNIEMIINAIKKGEEIREKLRSKGEYLGRYLRFYCVEGNVFPIICDENYFIHRPKEGFTGRCKI